jgi:hypothetical protein
MTEISGARTVAILLAVFVPTFLRAQEATFHARSSLVLVDTIVVDPKTGVPPSRLTRNDFKVFDNGHQVPIATFASGAHLATRPIALWFIVVCRTVGGDEQGSGFIAKKTNLLEPAFPDLDKKDKVGVAHWCDTGDADIDLPLTTNRDAPLSTLEAVLSQKSVLVPFRGRRQGAAIRKAIELINENTRKEKPEPLPVLVFLFGARTGMMSGEANAILNDLLKASAIVYCINNRYMNPSLLPDLHQAVIHYESAETGGEVFSTKPALFATALKEILVQVHFRYELGFKPLAIDGAHHELKVELTKQAAETYKPVFVRFRQEYIASPESLLDYIPSPSSVQ